MSRRIRSRVFHLEEAASHPISRYILGGVEEENGRLDRAAKHWSILKKVYRAGILSKEDFATALRAHQAAVDATRSPQREIAEAALQKFEASKADRKGSGFR